LILATLVLGATTTLGAAVPAQARPAPVSQTGQECHDGEAGSSARGGDPDHRDITASEQRAISRATAARLRAQGLGPAAIQRVSATIPVYVHVMVAEDGSGDVTDQQVTEQIAVLNAAYAGAKSRDAARTGFSFALAGVERHVNDAWHRDRSSTTYRKATRRGGPDALNMWLVDFRLLGIATFPWDYEKNPEVDGVRVHYASLPGGDIANYNLGETATHEVGHWLGLYHTFQGGCTELNDEVADTPAQAGPTSGCPEGADTCELPGLDPIHNFMDYSYDSCYTEFTPGQATRAQGYWAAYRAA
jgi:hypothetical protein